MIVGHFKLMDLVGIGGMGEVWLAEQREPVSRRAALKLIKLGMDTKEVIARFESERQALALMDHPAIAKVFDAGSTPQGRPYFVMEYVNGRPITLYCDAHRLTIRERLELFIRVCEGVQHAHQKAVIHRDLKPANILVTEVDGKALPKIIDFGLAKAMGQRLTVGTLYTRVGTMIGTPEYMSPEQAETSREDVDTRSDVYSLGVVLYEMATGTVPFDFRHLSFEDALRRVSHEEPAKPSAKVMAFGKEQAAAAAWNRRTDKSSLVSSLRGDLDAIIRKALEKDRSIRYGAPLELAADIGRYLRHEPVAARSAHFTYRAHKFVRRHRLGLVIAVTAATLVILFAAAQFMQIRRIRLERDRADRITTFMTDMFRLSSPSQSRGNKVTVREILDKAAKNVAEGLAKDPELQVQMMLVMGTVYENLGLSTEAEPLLSRAVQIGRRDIGSESRTTLRAMSTLAGTLFRESRSTEAERLARETWDLQRRVLGTQDPDTLTTMDLVAAAATLRHGYSAEAEQLYRQLLEARRRVLGENDLNTLRAMVNLGNVLADGGRYVEAADLEQKALEAQRRVLGPDHPDTARTMRIMANVFYLQSRYGEAENIERDAFDVQRRVLGPDHPVTLEAAIFLALLLCKEQKYTEAGELRREIVDIEQRVRWREHATSAGLYKMASLEGLLGNRPEAISLLRSALDRGLQASAALNMGTDEDLKSLRGDAGFEALVEDAHRRIAAEAAKPH
jgi:non-specific serine/threonine protein kinase/serine/threonine-protein kinase